MSKTSDAAPADKSIEERANGLRRAFNAAQEGRAWGDLAPWIAAVHAADASRPGLSEKTRDILQRARERLIEEPGSQALDDEIVALLRASCGEIPEEVRTESSENAVAGWTQDGDDWIRRVGSEEIRVENRGDQFECTWYQGDRESLIIRGDLTAVLMAVDGVMNAGSGLAPPGLPEIQSPITDAAIDKAVAEAKADPFTGVPEEERERIRAIARDAADAAMKDGGNMLDAGVAYRAARDREVVAYRAQTKADPLAGLPEEERRRIEGVGLAARFRTYRDSGDTKHDLATKNERDAIAREVAAYRARQGVPETLTREEAEKRLRALDLSDKVLGRCLDVPRDVLNEIGWGTGDQVKGARVAVILRAYVRGLDAQGAAS